MAEFTGERVIPGLVDDDLFNEHFARYVFASRLSRNRRVHDAGCGSGYGSLELARTAKSVVGIDVSEEAIGYARENFQSANLKFEQGDCVALPVADGSVDLVVAFEVIEHLANWRQFINESKRVLTPDGQLVVSTPNKLYYAESRQTAGPNPFHVHEFDFEEFRSELGSVFPHVSMFVENHSEAVVFQPVPANKLAIGNGAEVRVQGEAPPNDSHFFLAVCASRTQTGSPTFVFVPKSANVLREREMHIAKLDGELLKKDEWLEKAKRELGDLNQDHQKVLEMVRAQKQELAERAAWTAKLNEEIKLAAENVAAMERQVEKEHSAAQEMAAGYEAKIGQLEEESRKSAQWALDTRQQLDAKVEELGECVKLLTKAEALVEERTHWALGLEKQVEGLQRKVSLASASRWIKLGRTFGIGPELE